ncbi:hypothetical protein IAQ61_001296 [Plenodomus lingam]|nr:hypothetical protein IAQ61_001296 [Plenodomus lingam]
MIQDMRDIRGRRRIYVNIEENPDHNGVDFCARFVGIQQSLEYKQWPSTRSTGRKEAQQKRKVNQAKSRNHAERHRKKVFTATSIGPKCSETSPLFHRLSRASLAGPAPGKHDKNVPDKSSIRIVNQGRLVEQRDNPSTPLNPPNSPFVQPMLTQQQSATLVFGQEFRANRRAAGDSIELNSASMGSNVGQGSQTVGEDIVVHAATSGSEPTGMAGPQDSSSQVSGGLIDSGTDESLPITSKFTYPSQAPSANIFARSRTSRHVNRPASYKINRPRMFGTLMSPPSPQTGLRVSEASRHLLSNRHSRLKGKADSEMALYALAKR